jgi:predicted dehydrogenase
MGKLRVAVLGAGFMGGTHAKALATIDQAEVAGISGQSADRARPLADELGTRWTTDWRELVADPTIDAVDICLPGGQHLEATEAALSAGKHVLLEKPIALDLADAEALAALAATTDRTVMVAHVLRFWPEYVELQRRVASGEYGKPVSALAYRRQPFPAWSKLFSQSALTGGGVVDMMIHDFDALNWVLGAPVSVAGRGLANPRSGGWDQVQVMVEYAGGASGLVDGGMMMPESYPFTSVLHVLCERGALEYTFQAGGRSVEMGQGTNTLRCFPNEGDPFVIACEASDPYRNEIAYFVDCALAGKPAARATAAESLIALKLALAARDAVSAGSLGVVAV